MEKDREQGIANFIRYNNAVPIALGFVFLASGAAFAATPEARDAVYAREDSLASIDNSYLIATDIERYPFSMRVTKVTEDDVYYYLDYDFETIDIVDGVWQDVTKVTTLRVSKALLGDKELDAYAESELAQVRFADIDRLLKTQAQEKRYGMSQKVVATVHTGLVGKFIKPSEEVVPQYESKIDKDDPLRVKDPEPLITWDENALPEEGEGGSAGDPHGIPDACPEMEAHQMSLVECPGYNPPREDDAPPIEEPAPVEEQPPLEETPEPQEPEPTVPEPQPIVEETDGEASPEAVP